MTTQEKIGLLEIQKEQIESQIEVAKAELFLVELFETATFTSSVMIAGGFHEGAQRVFSSFSWLFSEGSRRSRRTAVTFFAGFQHFFCYV